MIAFDRHRLVLSLAEADADALVGGLREAAADTDVELVEVRLDALAGEPPFAALRAAFPRGLVATVRAREEGGLRPLDDRVRRDWLSAAVEAGFDAIDVELRSRLVDDPKLGRLRKRTILSWHGADRGDRLRDRLREAAASAPALVKLVTTAEILDDGRPILELVRGRRSEVPLAAFAMGKAGLPTRILAPRLGSRLTYVARTAEQVTASGQPSLAAARDYLLDRVDPRRPERLFGIVATSPERTLSPRLHNACFERIGARALYLPLPIADFARDAEPILAQSDFLGSGIPLRGLSVTIPWKGEALARAASATPDARRAGAANTLVRSGRSWRGANTDVVALRALVARSAVRGASAIVLGAGGAARAAVVALRQLGMVVVLAARSPAARLVAEELGAEWRRWEAGDELFDALVVVNATPLGSRDGDPSPVPLAWLQPQRVIVDFAYRPDPTQLVREARARGATVVDGFALLAVQGWLQARRFLRRPDLDLETFLGPNVLPDWPPGGISLPDAASARRP